MASAPALVRGVIPAAILKMEVGKGNGQIGVTDDQGPSTFRIAADGSIRVMDTVNKRMLFFNGTSGHLERTVNLPAMQRPADFAVTGSGDLYVLDTGNWVLHLVTLEGKSIQRIPLNRSLRGIFTTISLTADGRVFGLAGERAYLLTTAQAPIPPAEQINAWMPGTMSVRSNANFDLVSAPHHLWIANIPGPPVDWDLGKGSGNVSFLDVNQGMEPYLTVTRNHQTEIRRYGIDGHVLGTLVVDQQGCRPAARSVYVDRPGGVWIMCVGSQNVRFERYIMTNGQGVALPLHSVLAANVPWAPGQLQASPG